MKKILIVDDEKDIRFILEEILSEKKYSVVAIGTIKEAEEYINKNTFDLALLDVLLDEKSRDGLYLLNLIKNKKRFTRYNDVRSCKYSNCCKFCKRWGI